MRTSSSSAPAPRARPRRTTWRRPGSTRSCWRRPASPARRSAATGSPRAACTAWSRWASHSARATAGSATRACGCIGGGHRLELHWPELASWPDYGLVRPRLDFDEMLVRHAEKAGARLHDQVTVTDPLLDERPAGWSACAPAPRTARATSGPRWCSPRTASPAGWRSRSAWPSGTTGRWASPSAATTPARARTTTTSSLARPVGRPPGRHPPLAARLRLDLRHGRRHGQRRARHAQLVRRVPGRRTTASCCPAGSAACPRSGASRAERDRPRRAAPACRWASTAPRTTPAGCCWPATPPARSTRSTARASLRDGDRPDGRRARRRRRSPGRPARAGAGAAAYPQTLQAEYGGTTGSAGSSSS